jgi:hypothetical protein
MQWNSLSMNTSNEKKQRKKSSPNPKSLIPKSLIKEQKQQKKKKQKLLFVVPRCQYQMYYGKYILPQNQIKMITRFVYSYNDKLIHKDYNKIIEVESEIRKQNYELYVNHSLFRKLAVLERKRWFKQHVLKKMFTILKKRRPRPQ